MENKEKPIVVLQINDAAKMSKLERLNVAAWLEDAAKELYENGSNYSGRYIARYWRGKNK